MDSTPETFNEDNACDVSRAIWLKMARSFHAYVDMMCDDGIPYDSIERAKTAIAYGFLADACYWQATGVSPSPDLIELLDLKKVSE